MSEFVAPQQPDLSPTVRTQLQCTPEQQQRLTELRSLFTQACNALAPMVQQTRCWNRVALHHMAYKPLRDRFPQLGSQMACNAIYSVSRAAHRVYQQADSPHHHTRLEKRALPLLRFKGRVPVYFDRHTLSLKSGAVSLFTHDGRMRFNVDLTAENEQRLRHDKLREIVLAESSDGLWSLTFVFAPLPAGQTQSLAVDRPASESPTVSPISGDAAKPDGAADWPEYLVVCNEGAAADNASPLTFKPGDRNSNPVPMATPIVVR